MQHLQRGDKKQQLTKPCPLHRLGVSSAKVRFSFSLKKLCLIVVQYDGNPFHPMKIPEHKLRGFILGDCIFLPEWFKENVFKQVVQTT